MLTHSCVVIKTCFQKQCNFKNEYFNLFYYMKFVPRVLLDKSLLGMSFSILLNGRSWISHQARKELQPTLQSIVHILLPACNYARSY